MIDAHTHMWVIDPARYPWHPTLANVPMPTVPATVEEFIGEADCVSLDLAIAVQPSVYGWDNGYLCAAVERYPDRLIGVCMVDPLSPSAATELDRCYQRGCRGLRINTITQVDVSWLFGPDCSALLEATNDLRVPVELQIDLAHAPAVLRLARANPGLRIVLEYLGPSSVRDEAGRQALTALGDCPAIHLKVLMAVEESMRPWPHDDLWPFYRHALDVFGAERLMFGTAWPSQRSHVSYSRAWQWLAEWPFLSPTQRDSLHGGTARRVFCSDSPSRKRT